MPLFADGEAVLHGIQEILGRKWQPILVYRLLEDGPTGFSDLKRGVDGISSKMLSESLAELESAELVERAELSDSPVRVEYTLTERGRALEPIIADLIQWGCEYDIGETDSPDDATKHTETGRPAAHSAVQNR
jgi:DNA-binding HxlR family transcriptional regulator